MPSTWHIEFSEESKRLYLFKNGERMKAEGNFKDGERPFIGGLLHVRPHGKEYLVVSHLLIREDLQSQFFWYQPATSVLGRRLADSWTGIDYSCMRNYNAVYIL